VGVDTQRGRVAWTAASAKSESTSAEEGELAAVSTQSSPADNPLASFGPNEWIVEDIYQQFLTDPSSVDPAWHEFFADYKPATGSPAAASAPAPAAPAHSTTADGAGTPAAATVNGAAPAKEKAPAKPAAPAAAKPVTDGKKPAVPVPAGAQTLPLRGAAARIVTPPPACGPSRRSSSPTTASSSTTT
jgi:multifunctional 2-oxoglutarate metabolism enzyme